MAERDPMYIYTPIYMYLLVISNDGINRCHYISLLCVAARFLYSLIKYIHIWYPVFTRFRIHSLPFLFIICSCHFPLIVRKIILFWTVCNSSNLRNVTDDEEIGMYKKSTSVFHEWSSRIFWRFLNGA
jgi:hypothetical protein